LQIACLGCFVTQRIDFVGLFSFSGELPADRAILGTLIAVLQANFQRNVEKQAIGQNTRRHAVVIITLSSPTPVITFLLTEP